VDEFELSVDAERGLELELLSDVGLVSRTA
jgi:hypothetical protein